MKGIVLQEELTEKFDVLNNRGEKTGDIISRDEAHKIGAWHGAFHCLIIYKRDNRAYALFQKRAVNKMIAPDKYDVSVGGHYSSGEDARVAGPREIREELGLAVKFDELVPLGRRVFVYGFTPGVMEYEFQEVFLLDRMVQPAMLSLQQEEVSGVLEMEIEQGVCLFGSRSKTVEASLYRSSASPKAISVTKNDFVPCIDNYYLKLLLLAQRYMRGERELLVI